MDISYKDPENTGKDIDIIIIANFSATTSINTIADVPQTGTWYNYLTDENVNIRCKNQVLTLKK
jgi:hypothetical protein